MIDAADLKSGPDVSPEALALLKDALVWDAHGGFTAKPDQTLDELSIWERNYVDFLSINVGMDLHTVEDAIRVLAAYRHWIAARPDRFLLVEKSSDILKAKSEGKMAIAFDLEGAMPLGNQLSMLQLYRRMGMRQMHFVYNAGNSAGGGCQDDDDRGLTDFGRELVRECNRLGVLLDLSHMGERTTMDVIAASEKPVVFSHSNSKALIDHPRNITDAQMQAVAAKGGLVGVTGVGRFMGDVDAKPETFVRAIDMTVERIGIDHTAIGIDYTFRPGGPNRSALFWPAKYYIGTYAYMSPAQLPEVTDLLLRRGYSEADIRRVYGSNYFALVENVWDVETGVI